jgi:hypothetical protein
MFKKTIFTAGLALIAALAVPQLMNAQSPYDRNRNDQYDRNRYDPYEARDPYARLPRIEAGTYVTVRTRQPIDTDRRDGRVFGGTVDRDVWDDNGRLAMPAIPRGSSVEMIVRTERDGDLILDLESVVVGGQRYAVDATPNRVEAGRERGFDGGDAAGRIGGGAIIGSIIGAIAGGGKGAAIGAGVGAGVGAATLATHGRYVRVPPGSLVTFRLDEPLILGVRDGGYSRDREHFHRDDRNRD